MLLGALALIHQIHTLFHSRINSNSLIRYAPFRSFRLSFARWLFGPFDAGACRPSRFVFLPLCLPLVRRRAARIFARSSTVYILITDFIIPILASSYSCLYVYPSAKRCVPHTNTLPSTLYPKWRIRKLFQCTTSLFHRESWFFHFLCVSGCSIHH